MVNFLPIVSLHFHTNLFFFLLKILKTPVIKINTKLFHLRFFFCFVYATLKVFMQYYFGKLSLP